MTDPALQRIQPAGRTSLWTYGDNRNFPGWHLCCDRPAAAFLLALLDAMPAARWPAKKRIPLAADPALSSATGCAATPRFAKALEIHFDSAHDPALWRLEERADGIALSLGANMLKALRQGVRGLADGKGDYSIGDPPGLWFWWEVKTV